VKIGEKSTERKTPATQTLGWKRLKAAIILQHGSIKSAAELMRCSVNGLRMAAIGKCPGILERLKNAGFLTDEEARGPVVRSGVCTAVLAATCSTLLRRKGFRMNFIRQKA
jgi:hypothetical protein